MDCLKAALKAAFHNIKSLQRLLDIRTEDIFQNKEKETVLQYLQVPGRHAEVPQEPPGSTEANHFFV